MPLSILQRHGGLHHAQGVGAAASQCWLWNGYGSASQATGCTNTRKAATGIVAAFHHPRGTHIRAKTATVEITVVMILTPRNAPAGDRLVLG